MNSVNSFSRKNFLPLNVIRLLSAKSGYCYFQPMLIKAKKFNCFKLPAMMRSVKKL